MKQYQIIITCQTMADSPDEAVAIAMEQVNDLSAYAEVLHDSEVEDEGTLGGFDLGED